MAIEKYGIGGMVQETEALKLCRHSPEPGTYG